ncbi:MAG: tripartite tricarboxylate transporter TctB family protein [Marinobacter sp.]|jgi:hypothetical protein
MIHLAGRKVLVEWGHLAVATLIAVTCLWYLQDARSASLRIANLILIQPGVIVAIILYLIVLPQCFHVFKEEEPITPKTEEEATKESSMTPAEFLRVASLAAAFGVFVFSLERFGFDLAAWLFMAVGLFICGERRWPVLAFFPPAFALIVVYGYQQLIPYPIETFFL